MAVLIFTDYGEYKLNVTNLQNFVTKTRSKKSKKEKQQSELLLVSSDSDEAENDIQSMAMIKEKQRDKGSVDKKSRNNSSGSAVASNDGCLKSDVLENDIEIKDESFRIAENIMEKVSSNSPTSVTCSFADTKTFAMDICPVDPKLDGNTFNSNLSAVCKSQVKTEDIISADADFSPDSCDNMLSSISMNVSSNEPLVDGIQPLSSNVINKQPSTMDAQYMQQQSQVFVFSTTLANKSAESVYRGEYEDIIAYHCAQPKTKKYLERHSLKVGQFNRQNNPPWLNSMNQIKPKNLPVGSNRCGIGRGAFRNSLINNETMNHSGSPGTTLPPSSSGMNAPSRLPMWNQQGTMNAMSMNSGNQPSHIMPMCNNNNNALPRPGIGPMQPTMNSVLPGQMGPNSGNILHSGVPPMKCSSQTSSMEMISESSNSNPLLSNNVLPNLGNFSEDQLALSPHTSLIGVKVPDENLTPEQKLHRKEQLATLRKIGEILLPENHQTSSHHAINSEIQQQPSVHNQISVDDLSAVLTADSASDMSNLQKTVPNTSHPDWQKMQPFFDDRKRKSEVANMGRCGSRSQGPPPPYHPTQRSASVPIAISSPNPNSPGNATSNLSLPSPRTCSGLNSPASKQGPGPSPTTNQLNTSIESPSQTHNRGVNISNPGTPVSSTMHLSPNSKQKDAKLCSGPLSNEFSPATSGQQSPDGIFCRTLQSLAQQQQQKQQPQLPHTQPLQSANSHCKEPNLMPVPSPQHIQYLNTFEGQELTIQKQPNTSLKETGNIVSPSLSAAAAIDTIIPVSTTDGSCSKVSVSAPNTPLTPTSLELGSRYPGTPADFTALSPSGDPKSVPPPLRGNNTNQLKNDLRFSCSSPQLSDQQRYQPTTTNFMPQSSKNSFMDVSSPEKISCSLVGENKEPPCSGNFPRMGSDNVPLNPAMNPTSKPSQFDPISSLAQMSQQLTNNVPSSPGGQPGGMMHSGMMPYNSGAHMPPNNMHMMQMNDMGMCANPVNEPPMQDNSRMVYNPQMVPGMNMGIGNSVTSRMMPCPGGNENLPSKAGMMQNPYSMMSGNSPRMMSRPPGSGPLPNSYNGANIQVKPNAPNTIQYLPNRPQSTNVGPRGPPSLEFLHRFSNPMPPNMENKIPTSHNMNYFPNNYPTPGTNMNDMMSNMNCNMPAGNAMIRPGMRPNNPANMMRMGNMGGMPPYGNEQMYPTGGPNSNMTNSNCHMFMPGSANKMASMNMPGGVAPDATQPLPPSIGQSNNFKNSSFPTTADPTYAQQFHNFQQQLYATNTRSQMNNQSMAGTNQQYFVPK